MRTATIDNIKDENGIALTITTNLNDGQIKEIVEVAQLTAMRRGVCCFNRLKMMITDAITLKEKL